MNIIKKYGLFLSGLGISNFGNWIYLIALNVLVYNLTKSAAAIAGIYMIGPLARIFASFFAGSFIDRTNKRHMMIFADLLRGILVLLVPFMQSIWFIYLLLFIINIAASFFGPSSVFYITKFVPEKDRLRFNSILSFLNSGSFLIGPALAGILIYAIGTTWTVIINALSFFICAWFIFLLPDVDERLEETKQRITFQMIKKDFKLVGHFLMSNRIFFIIFFLFQMTLMIFFALDSQEITFIKQHLAVNDQLYGVLVSVCGVGSICGAALCTFLANRLSIRIYISFGLLLTSISYTCFYASNSFIFAMIAFISLGFFMSFSNTGFDTFYQQQVPSHLMGRFGSTAAIFQNLLQLLLTFILGLCANWFPLQITTVLVGIISIVLALLLCGFLYTTTTKKVFEEV